MNIHYFFSLNMKQRICFTEEKTTEEFAVTQKMQIQSEEAQHSVQQQVFETSQSSQQVQMVALSKEQVVTEQENQLLIQAHPSQDVTVRQEVTQMQQVTSEQPQLLMRENQAMATGHVEQTQTITTNVVQQQASFGMEEKGFNQSVVEQVEVRKSPTVVRKVKKIIKRPKKQVTESVEVVEDRSVISEDLEVQQPEAPEPLPEFLPVEQKVEEEKTIVTQVVQQPQTFTEEISSERLITTRQEEQQVEVKPTKIVKKKVVKKVVKKPVVQEQVEVTREEVIEDTRKLWL